MPTDLLVLAGNAAAALEQHGFTACGRRENGQTRVEFWTRAGTTYRHVLRGDEGTVEEIVAACLAVADSAAAPPKTPPSSRVLN